jgi:hypothetical protein
MADEWIGLIVVFGVLGLILASVFGWAAPSIATTEQVCSNANHVCGSTERGCETGVMTNQTRCTANHISAPIKAESWSVGGMIALCVLLYIIAEVIIIKKARKGEWAHTEWGFIGVNILALLMIVGGVGAFNLVQAWFGSWVITIDWMATLLWFLVAFMYVLLIGTTLLALYLLKVYLWLNFVVPAREEALAQANVPAQIPSLTPKRKMGRPKGSKNKRRVGRPRKVQ